MVDTKEAMFATCKETQLKPLVALLVDTANQHYRPPLRGTISEHCEYQVALLRGTMSGHRLLGRFADEDVGGLR